MFFVWSWWFLVVALFVAGIVTCAVLLVKMNKKDVQLIEEFQQANAAETVEPSVEEKEVKSNS